MKFKVIDTEPPEQELRCPRCNNRFRTDPSIQMNLVLINNVLLPQCPICKTIEDEPEFKKEEAKMKFLVIEENFPDYKIKCPRCCRSFWVGFSDPTKNANIIEKNGEWMPWCPFCECTGKENVLNLKKEAKMNIKDCTQTKDGTPVRIYATDGGGKFPVHGAVFNKDDCHWTILTWTITGSLYLTGDEHGLDLDLSDWKEKIPWDCLRPEIKVVARDDDGRWFGHEIEPNKDAQDGIWCSAGHEIYALDGVKMPQGPADWKEAIARRPE
jgi:hypothetical protein